jgi:hypothetical protein
MRLQQEVCLAHECPRFEKAGPSMLNCDMCSFASRNFSLHLCKQALDDRLLPTAQVELQHRFVMGFATEATAQAWIAEDLCANALRQPGSEPDVL